jgi:hypothetical protein
LRIWHLRNRRKRRVKKKVRRRHPRDRRGEKKREPGIVAHACNSGTWKAKAGRS